MLDTENLIPLPDAFVERFADIDAALPVSVLRADLGGELVQRAVVMVTDLDVDLVPGVDPLAAFRLAALAVVEPVDLQVGERYLFKGIGVIRVRFNGNTGRINLSLDPSRHISSVLAPQFERSGFWEPNGRGVSRPVRGEGLVWRAGRARRVPINSYYFILFVRTINGNTVQVAGEGR